MKSLDEVLERSEVIKGQVEESAEDLARVNDVLSQGVASNVDRAALHSALEQTEGIEDGVRDVADDLNEVNRALGSEVEVGGGE